MTNRADPCPASPDQTHALSDPRPSWVDARPGWYRVCKHCGEIVHVDAPVRRSA